ncbi:MAG: hypothetical protein ABFD18_13335, partial [Syntrophomonas sp.]
MQYQLVLILFNMVIALAAYFFLRDRRHIFRLVIMPIVYAYFLAAFLPYLLAYVPVNWVIAFYTGAILLGFLAKGIDARVQPEMEADGWDGIDWSEADLDFVETHSEREALLNTVHFSKTRGGSGAPLLSRLLSESSSLNKNSSSSETVEPAGPVHESSILSNISPINKAAASTRSYPGTEEKSRDEHMAHEKISSMSILSSKDTSSPVEEAPQRSISRLHQSIQQEEAPAHKSTYVLRDITSNKQAEEEMPVKSEPSTTTLAVVSELSEYREEKAALASVIGGTVEKSIEPTISDKLQPGKTKRILDKAPLHAAAEIELDKQVVEEIAQKFADKIHYAHQEEASPTQDSETQLVVAKLSDATQEQFHLAEEAHETRQDDVFHTEESELPVIAASLADTSEGQLNIIEENRKTLLDQIGIAKDESPPIIAAAVAEAPAERHLELVEASSEPHPKIKESDKFEGVEALPINQQIPVQDAGEMVLDKESIKDQQEATEDDLMQLDLALVIDRA